MTITQMKYFLVSAKYCNLRQASSELFVTQQVLSKQIKALETELGVLLFARKKQRIQLTEAGKYMYDVWMPLLEQTEAAIEYVRNMECKQTVRIGVPDVNGIIERLLAFVDSESAGQQDYEVEIVSGTMNKLLDLFQKNEVDLLLFFSIDLRLLSGKYYCETLQEIPFGVIMSKNHIFSGKSGLSLADLNQETIYIFNNSYAQNVEQGFLAECQKAGFVPKSIRTFMDWKNMELALSSGKGVAVTYRSYLPQDSKRLVFIPFRTSTELPSTHLVLLWKNDKYRGVVRRIQKTFDEN